MPKRDVTFTKPDEPSFLKKLKEQAGYKEGPTVDTKRQDLDIADEEDFEDTLEEQPTVVVLKSGDLTAEEAAQVKVQLEKEADETPADLAVPIVFKAPSKQIKDPVRKSQKRQISSEDQETSKKIKNKSLLSFDDEEED